MPGNCRVLDSGRVGGGCISDAQRVDVQDHDGRERILFVKRNDLSFLDNFQSEWDGLTRLSDAQVIGVPRPLAVGASGESAWLITEWIESGRRENDFFVRFGRDLAELHRATLGDRIGLDRDNYLGSARQLNSPDNFNSPGISWPDFFAEQRIGFQIRWAVDQGLADTRLAADGERIAGEMDRLLEGRENATSLLHGDLWSGNYLVDELGAPVIIDPAVYYGHREADLAMVLLFGGFPPEFIAAYDEAWPLESCWQERVEIYKLFHLVNHVNLFGDSYVDGCMRILRRFV